MEDMSLSHVSAFELSMSIDHALLEIRDALYILFQ